MNLIFIIVYLLQTAINHYKSLKTIQITKNTIYRLNIYKDGFR
jgi:hypothetical protein